MSLVLKIHNECSVWIGGARVTVSIQRGGVKLVVDAPPEVAILREELLARTDPAELARRRGNLAAASEKKERA